MKLVIVRGIPGTGKSTFARTRFSNIFHIENDFFHYVDGKYAFDPKRQDAAVKWCMNMTETALSNGFDACVSNTFTRKRYVDAYRRLAEKYGAEFEVYRMHGDFENLHDVPGDVYENMKAHFDDYEGEIDIYPTKEAR